MRVVFLKPPIGGILGLEMLTFVEPLGLECVAAALLPEGHECRIYDLRIDGEDLGLAKCHEFDPDVVGVQCNFTTERNRALQLARRVRRELPRAFVRRCVILDLPPPTEDELAEIAKAVLPTEEHDEELFRRVAEHAVDLHRDDDGEDAIVSTAEYLDTLRACVELGIGVDHKSFEKLTQITLRKDVTGGETWL